MIRFITQTVNMDGTVLCDGFCLHDDEKPTENLATGSSLVEVDTGDCYLFDEESGDWLKLGGSSDSDIDESIVAPIGNGGAPVSV